jgi:Icc-related predicted phosphoesterase
MSLWKRAGKERFRYYFATDVHGSDRCFRKFLAAAKAYEAKALILGGDIAGKAIVPFVRQGDGTLVYTAQGETHRVSEDALEAAMEPIRFNGFYPYVCDEEEARRIADDEPYRESVFEQTIVRQVQGWCDLAGERLDDDVACVITPGNDDIWAIDEILSSAERIASPERAVMKVGPAWLASLGNTNRTPWDTDREYDEDELGRQIDTMVGPYADGRPLIFNFHCPPYDSGLDRAIKLDADWRPVFEHGSIVEGPVGSTAVRAAIERYRPVVGLHGHIHESHGVRKIGPTVCINPGSDYSGGVLKGAIVDLDEEGGYMNHLLTTG